MNIVFMGTPDFAVPSLEKLIEKYDVKAVFTQPDRPKGRGKKLGISPVKETALKHEIPTYQPVRIKKEPECIEKIRDISPDFIIVVAFGQILPKEVLDIPRYGCINLHASLLPKYRGAAPLNWAIIRGEKETGNTTMFMSEGLDCGDMLLRSRIDIDEDMTYGELHDILMKDGPELLTRTIDAIVNGSVNRIKQEDSESSYAPMLSKTTGIIDWKLKSADIKNLIRGLNPFPSAHTQYKELTMKIFEADVINEKSSFEPGVIIDVNKEGIKVATGDGVLLIKRIQFPGGKPLNVEEYLRGNTIEKGLILK